MLAIFGFLMALNYDASVPVWIIGFFCWYLSSENDKTLLAIFGFFMAIGYDASFLVWIVGFFCWYMDCANNKSSSTSVSNS